MTYAFPGFKERNYEVHMYFVINSNISPRSVSVFDIGTIICTSSIPLKRYFRIHPIHIISLRSAFGRPVQVMGEIIMFIQLGDLHVFVYFWRFAQPCRVLTRPKIVNWQIYQGKFSEWARLLTDLLRKVFWMSSPSSLCHIAQSLSSQNIWRRRICWLCYRLPRTRRLIQKIYRTATIERHFFQLRSALQLRPVPNRHY